VLSKARGALIPFALRLLSRAAAAGSTAQADATRRAALKLRVDENIQGKALVVYCDAAYMILQPHKRAPPMTRFFQWLDKLAMAHPYAAMALFQLP
jgi:hypothetical protein